MARRREAIAGVLLTTWGAAWIAAIVAAASPKRSLFSSLFHGASLLLLIFGLICAIVGVVVLRASSADSTTPVFRIEASPAVEFGVLTEADAHHTGVYLRTIHAVRITNQQPTTRLIVELYVRITMPDGRVFNKMSLSATDPQRDLRDLDWLNLPVEVEAQQTVTGTVGFISFDLDAVLESRVELDATDLVSGASVLTRLGKPGVATRRNA